MGITDYMTLGELKSFLSSNPTFECDEQVKTFLKNKKGEDDKTLILVEKRFSPPAVVSVRHASYNELYNLVG